MQPGHYPFPSFLLLHLGIWQVSLHIRVSLPYLLRPIHICPENVSPVAFATRRSEICILAYEGIPREERHYCTLQSSLSLDWLAVRLQSHSGASKAVSCD